MTTSQHLLETLRQWEQWSRLEGQAIEHDDWPRVNACQQAKAVLREQIATLRAVAASPGSPAGLPQTVRDALARLISMERENADRLATRRSAAECSVVELDDAILNLRKVQRSYARPALASWISYS